jgi:hypothetical protein
MLISITDSLIGIIGTITVAAIAGGVAIYQTIANVKLTREKQKVDIELAKQKLDAEQNIIKYDIVNNLLKFSQYQKLYDAVIKIMEHSKVDRFLIFIAINGKTELSNVTCVFQKYKHDKAELDAIAVYRGLKVDEHYVKMLKKMEFDGHVHINVAELEPSLIKNIYESEHVTFSKWDFIGRINIDDKNDVIAYCSSSTFDLEGYNSKDLLAIKLHFDSSIKPRFIKTINQMIKN